MKASFLFLVLVISISCSRNSKEETDFEVQQTATNKSNVKNKNQEGNYKIAKSTKSDSTEKVNYRKQNKLREQTHQQPNKNIYNEDNSKSPLWNWWMIVGLSSLFLNLFFVFKLLKSSFTQDRLREEREDLKKQQKKLNSRIESLTSNKDKLRSDKKTKLPKNEESKKGLQSEKKQNVDDEKSPDISLSVEVSILTNNPVKEPITLYAEKADDSGVFSQVSEQKDEHKSIFKFNLNDINDSTAHFEILNSNFILKLVANSPDIYLFTACKPENSNQNFTEEIITTQKGIAENIDGQWSVKKENKAIIKFQ
jgi:hypothetical protein